MRKLTREENIIVVDIKKLLKIYKWAQQAIKKTAKNSDDEHLKRIAYEFAGKTLNELGLGPDFNRARRAGRRK
jgi:hypothetical protein